MKKLKHLLWGGLALTVLFAGTSAAQAANAAQNLDYKLMPRFAGLDTTGLHLDLDVDFKNETSGRVTARDTLIEVRHGDSVLAKVDLAGKAVSIRPRSSGRLSDPDQLGGPVRLHIPYTVIQEYAPQAVSAFLGFGPPLTLVMKVRTRVKIPWVPEFTLRLSEPYTLEKPV